MKNNVYNSKLFFIIAVIAFVAGLASFVLALFNQNFIGAVIFIAASLYDLNEIIIHKKK